MNTDFQMNAEDFSAAGLGNAVACAVAIAVADGQMDGNEQEGIARSLCTMLGIDSETGAALVNQGLEAAAATEREALFEQARDTLEGAGREGCFMMACAVAARAGSIGTSEGVALQKLARTLEIGYPSAKYNELLGKGMRLAHVG